jgi:hypothetical protein
LSSTLVYGSNDLAKDKKEARIQREAFCGNKLQAKRSTEWQELWVKGQRAERHRDAGSHEWKMYLHLTGLRQNTHIHLYYIQTDIYSLPPFYSD